MQTAVRGSMRHRANHLRCAPRYGQKSTGPPLLATSVGRYAGFASQREFRLDRDVQKAIRAVLKGHAKR